MEDVLDVYQQPRDPDFPLVCLDEASKQLLADTREPVPMQPGQPARHDYEYERHGTSNLFVLFAPLEGWRHVKVTARRTAVDYAHMLKDLADKCFGKAKKIRLVQDNLNTHKPASLYEAFPPHEARRLVRRFEWHYTPKHGSWLNMAESEISVLIRQCLDRRIADQKTLATAVAAWQKDRNKHHAKADAKKDEGQPKNKTTSDADPSKAEAGEKAANSPSGYSRGEGQKPVSKAYRDNWNAIYAKKKKKKR